MRSAAGRVVAQFLVPNGLIVLGTALALHNRSVVAAIAPAANLGALAVFGLALLLSWRFHAPRVGMMACVLAVADWGLLVSGTASAAASPSGHAVFNVICLLLPLNYVVLALLDDFDVTLETLVWWSVLIVAQTAAVAVLSRPELVSLLGWMDTVWAKHGLQSLGVPPVAALAFLEVGLVLLIKAALSRRPLDIGWLWSLGACLLALGAHRHALASAYFGVAGLVLAGAVMETSYLMAYHDELTTLPARRAFQRATAQLAEPYAIAMVDIDHFKKFNDTFGHEVGDQVLRMVASRLARVTGGGEAFRLGGEEFAVLFRGRKAADVHYHVELLRQTVERANFTVRGPDRSQRERLERRRPHRRRRTRREKIPVRVTISIGVAGATAGRSEVEQVIRAADSALYQAKENGRNRVEVAPAARLRRTGERAAPSRPETPPSRTATSAD